MRRDERFMRSEIWFVKYAFWAGMCVGRGGVMHLRKETKANNYMIRRRKLRAPCKGKYEGHIYAARARRKGKALVVRTRMKAVLNKF